MPYAIVTYTVDGLEQDVDDVEPLVSDMPPQLQQIIERINAKANGHAAAVVQRPSLENSGRLPSLHSVPSTFTPAMSTISVVGSGGGMDDPAESSEANLQRVIAQINARLESQERSRQLALQNVALMSGAAALAPATHPDVYPTTPGRPIGRSIADQVAATGLSVLGASAARVDASSLGMTPITAASGAGLTGYSSGLAAATSKVTLAAGNVAAGGGGYVALGSGGRSAQFAVSPELVGVSSALAGMQYPSSVPVVSASPYLRSLPGLVDAAGMQ